MRVLRGIRPIYLVLGISLAAHLGVAIYFSQLASHNPLASAYPIGNGDSLHFVGLSEGLLERGEYLEAGEPNTGRIWPPAYPFLMAVSKAMTGSYIPLIVLQVAVALIAVSLVYRMSQEFVPPSFALAAALLYGLEPMYVLMNTLLYIDGLFSSALVITVYVAFFQARVRGPVRWGIVGVLLGCVVLLKPIAMYLIPLVPVAYFFHKKGFGAARTAVPSLAAYALCIVLVLAPWVIRFHDVYGAYAISQSGTYNMRENFVRPYLAWKSLGTFDPLSTLLVMRRQGEPMYEAADRVLQARLKEVVPPGEVHWNYDGAVAVGIILSDPLGYGYFHVINMAPFFLASSISVFEQYVHQIGSSTDFYAPTLSFLANALKDLAHVPAEKVPALLLGIAPIVLEMFFWVVVCLFATWALSLKRFEVFLFAALVLYFAVLTGPMAAARYRIPAEPYLFILAAIGAHLAIQHVRSVLRPMSAGR